ncbi:SRPBCC family protein [Paenibacillus sp. PAMC21692]|uniref:SRPBCC family protein n=1 Tax=Paenibacillus sp. PAMC21692 TaxID=2762320 RepID=UPI0021C391E3|nr:SRPBCC family protein [Paenibacillus sp. PAMC21692]
MLDALGRSLTEPAAADDGLELTTSRIYDVPRELAFAAWTTPDQLAEWWGPEGFTNTFHEIDFSPGGVWRLTMHGPDGTDYPNRNTFIEIVPNERIVLEHAEAPAFQVTALFEDAEGGTRVTFRQCFRHAEELEPIRIMCERSNEQNLDRLGKVLENAKRLSL